MVNFAAGQPIGPKAIKELQDKIRFLCETLGREYGRVQCDEITGTIDNGECIEVPNPLASTTENNSGIVDQKVIAFAFYPNVAFPQLGDNQSQTVTASSGVFGGSSLTALDSGLVPVAMGTVDSIPPASSSSLWTVTIKCGGNVVYTDSGSSNSLRLIQAHIDCPRNDKIEICFESRAAGNSAVQAASNARYCGVVLCAGNEVRTLTGLFKPPEIPEGCCYGREHLYLASQNLDALCRSLLSNRTQYVYCVQGESTEIDSIIVAANLPVDTQYFVWGEIFICYRNDSQDVDWTITVDPFVGCESSNSQCLGLYEVVPHREEGNDIGYARCSTIPIITCGSCPAGESITAGLTYDAECSPEVATAVGSGRVVITSVRQKYCVWLFSDVEIDGLPPATDLVLGKCATDVRLLPMQEKCEELEEVIVGLPSANLTTRNIGPLSGLGQQDWLFQAAEPWQGAGPAPPKKWNIDVRVCSSLSNGNISLIRSLQNAIGILKFEIKCGNTVLIERETTWQMYRIGGSDFDQYEDLGDRCLSFADCIECDIDQDIRICAEFSINRVSAGLQFIEFGAVDLKIAKAFCF